MTSTESMSGIAQFNQIDPAGLAELLTYTIPAREPMMVTGKPGIGKSELIIQACRAAGADVIFIHAVVSDPTDAKGMPWVKMTADGDPEAVFIPFYELKRMLDADKLTVAFLDDFGQAPPSVQAAFMQLILARRINEHEVSPYVVFIAATNRREDGAGVSGILEPVKSRFTGILELVTSFEPWSDWALGTDEKMPIKASHITEAIPKRPIAMEVFQFVRMKQEFLDQFDPTPDMTNSPTPRTITNLSQFVKMNLPTHLQLHAFSGAVGNIMGSQFNGYLQFYLRMPDPDVVIKNPTTSPVPDINDPDAGASIMYALVGALAQRAKPDTMPNIIKYANRIPVEFQAYLMKDSTRLNESCKFVSEFIDWASNNADILI